MKFMSCLTAFGLATTASQGAYTFSGLSITETFDGMPTTSVAGVFSSTPGTQAAVSGTGFVGTKLSGTGTTNTPLTADAGAGTSGAIYSYGAATATERSLGSLASGSNVMGFGFEVVNESTEFITQITVSFTQETWRSSTSTVNTVGASYSTGAAGSATFLSASTGFTDATALSLVGPAFVTTNGALDGNLAANQVARMFTISGLSIPVGESFYLRWQDVNETGNDAGLAVDGLSLSFVTSPVPEPTSALLGALGFLAILRRRR